MKFCPVVPEICRGQVHVPKKERKKERRIIIIIIIIIYNYGLHEKLISSHEGHYIKPINLLSANQLGFY
jgi:hypothetical protein